MCVYMYLHCWLVVVSCLIFVLDVYLFNKCNCIDVHLVCACLGLVALIVQPTYLGTDICDVVNLSMCCCVVCDT